MLAILLSKEPSPCRRTSSGLKSVAKGIMYVRCECSRKAAGASWPPSPTPSGSARAIALVAGRFSLSFIELNCHSRVAEVGVCQKHELGEDTSASDVVPFKTIVNRQRGGWMHKQERGQGLSSIGKPPGACMDVVGPPDLAVKLLWRTPGSGNRCSELGRPNAVRWPVR